jgi:non-ribosomal peptide synthetase-like protein
VAGYFYLPLWAVFALLPLVSSGVALGSALSVVFLKWVVMGTFKPVIKPLWCVWIWTNEMMMGSFETVAQGIVEWWQGTPYACWFMRLMGCKIGKHVYLESILFSEFDLVEIGDYAALNLGSIGQTHLFEDRIFKSSYVKIGAECSVGNMTVVLYDTEMKDGSSIGSLSLLMKGETLAADTRCIGIPMREIK